MFVLPLISILSALNKLIGSICDGVKQAWTQRRMFWTRKVQFEVNTCVRGHGILPNVSNTKCCQTAQGWVVESELERPQGWAVESEVECHKVERWKSGVERHSIRKTCHWTVEECHQAVTLWSCIFRILLIRCLAMLRWCQAVTTLIGQKLVFKHVF